MSDENTVYISFNADIDVKTTETLIGAAFNSITHGATHLYFLFSTQGGLVTQGIHLYNVFKGLPVKTTMHNVGAVDSIGNAIFLSAQERFACAHSTFMFHGVGFNLSNTQRFERKHMEEQLDSIRADENKIGGIITNETSLEREEVDGLFVQSQTKDASFALDKGLIHNIREVELPPGSNLIQLVFQR